MHMSSFKWQTCKWPDILTRLMLTQSRKDAKKKLCVFAALREKYIKMVSSQSKNKS